jgi:glycosyltransferase involved in cell wall biosynthesis
VRIAIVTTSWPASDDDAAGHFVRTEALALERAGHEVEVVAPRAGGAFGWPGVAARLRERPTRAFEAAAWVLDARRRLARSRAAHIVAHWALPSAWPIASSVAPGASLDVVSHGGDVRLLRALPGLVRGDLARRIASRARAWRFVSSALRDELLRALPARARCEVERVARVEPAALTLPDVREAVTDRRRSLAGRRVAVSVSRLVSAKRVDRAIEHVAGSRAFDVLVVVGDGPERARLERLARDRGVDARFVGVVGRREALTWIGAADAVLHASEAEGLSTVVREAEILGTPVIRIDPRRRDREGVAR